MQVEAAGARHAEEVRALEAMIVEFKKDNAGLTKKEMQRQVKTMRDTLTDAHTQEIDTLVYGIPQPQPTSPLSSSPKSTQPSTKTVTFPHESNPQTSQPQTPQPPRVSKSKQRLNKKQMQIDELRNTAREEVKLLPDLRVEEMSVICGKLASDGLMIHTVKADGNCLFYAISHQLLILCQVNVTVSELRARISEYMLANSETFLPFLVNDKGDSMTHDEFECYCEEIKSTSRWGGQHEIIAVTKIYGVKVRVYHAASNLLDFGESNTSTLLVSYHLRSFGLGEHYNSVVVL